MPEPFKDELAVFVGKGEQRKFIESVQQKYSVKQMAEICSCSERTIRDCRREKFDMQFTCVKLLANRIHIPVPKNIKVRHKYAHTRKAGKLGAHAMMVKYGCVPVDEHYRKAQWEKWWKKEGKFRVQPQQFYAQTIYKPRKSVELAEFIGTMMGDGGMHKYQAVVTLHHIDDREYIDFVIRRIKKLFRLQPSLYHIPKNSVFHIVISRIEAVKYLHALGLPIGNKVKQNFDIPGWIKKNKKFSIACIRGLVDTDGSVITHSYKVKGRQYQYKKLSFCSRSKPLQYSVARILIDLDIHARISGYDVRIDSIADVRKYFSTVGSHNPKHLKRYAN